MTQQGEKFLNRLRPSEREVLVFVCEAKSNEQIAAARGISIQTTKNFVSTILKKFGLSSRVELAVFAFHHGMVECPCRGKRTKE